MAGYQGPARLHANSQTPIKKSKHHPLTKEQGIANRASSHVRILSEHYRNRRKRFVLHFNLIAAIYNIELAH